MDFSHAFGPHYFSLYLYLSFHSISICLCNSGKECVWRQRIQRWDRSLGLHQIPPFPTSTDFKARGSPQRPPLQRHRRRPPTNVGTFTCTGELCCSAALILWRWPGAPEWHGISRRNCNLTDLASSSLKNGSRYPHTKEGPRHRKSLCLDCLFRS